MNRYVLFFDRKLCGLIFITLGHQCSCLTVHENYLLYLLGEQLQLGIYESDYIGKLAEHTCMRQVGYLRVEETDQIEACVDDFLLQKPHLEMSVSVL